MMDKSKVFYDRMTDTYDKPMFDRYELQLNQKDFLYKIEDMWQYKISDEYQELLKTVTKVLEKGWYDEEEQFVLREVTDLYRDDQER